MFKDAKRQGFYLEVTLVIEQMKSKRNYGRKVQAFQDQGFSEQEAIETAESWVAKPRTSEHEVGLAVDINAQSKRSTDEEVTLGWQRTPINMDLFFVILQQSGNYGC